MGGILPGLVMATLLFTASRFLPRAAGKVTLARDGSIINTDYHTVLDWRGRPLKGVEQSARDPEADAAGDLAGGVDVAEAAANDSLDGVARTPVIAAAHAQSEHSTTEVTMTSEKAPGDIRRKAFIAAIPGLLVPVIIMGGIYGGIFTPTEAAIVSAFYALLVGFVFYRDLKVSHLPKMLVAGAVQSSVIMIIVGAASMLAYVITRQKVADTVSNLVLGISENPVIVMAMVIVLLLIVGCLMDAVSALYLFVPLLAPILLHLGYNNTTIGVMMTVGLAVGMITPPVGVNLFVAAGVSKLKLWDIVKGVPMFVIAGILTTIATAYIPGLANWLPDLLGM